MGAPTDQDYARLVVERGLVERGVALRGLEKARLQGRSFLEFCIAHGVLDRRRAEELIHEARTQSSRGPIAVREPRAEPLSATVSPEALGETEALEPSCVSASSSSSRSVVRAMPCPGDELGGYIVERELGRGSMGAVFLARRGETRFAIKIITSGQEAAAARFGREAEALAAVDRHPNIVRIHSFSQHQGLPYLVLDFVEGGSLEDQIKDGRRLAPERAAELCMKIAEALAFIHERGILHRDLKPDNILLRVEDGEPLLTDFGLAKAADSEALTRSGEVLGTPFYMSPEQVAGDHESIGARSDLWSLGVVLYQLSTGELPFGGRSTMELVAAICGAAPIPPRSHEPGLSPDLEAIILCCLEKDMELRYESCGALTADLRRYLTGEPVESRHSGIAGAFRRRIVKRLELPVLVSLAFGVLMFGGLGWLTARWAKQRRWREQTTQARRALAVTLGESRRGLYEHLAIHLAKAKNPPSRAACELLPKVEGQLAALLAIHELSRGNSLAEAAVAERLSGKDLARLRGSVALLRLIEAPLASPLPGPALPKAERALARALKAFADQRYGEARSAFEAAATSSRLAPAARLGQALAGLALGRLREAGAALERLPEKLKPLYRRPRIEVHAERAVQHIFMAKNAAFAASELAFLDLLDNQTGEAWRILTARLEAAFARCETAAARLRAWDFSQQLKRDHPAPWRLPSTAKIHKALAERARERGQVKLALRHFYKLRLLRPESPIPVGYRARDIIMNAYEGRGSLSTKPRETFELFLEASRAGIYTPSETRRVLEPLDELGVLDALVKAAPKDLYLRFWRARSEFYDHLQQHESGASRALLKRSLEDLNFCLRSDSLPPTFRAKLFELRARRHFDQDRKRDPGPLIRDLKEALRLPHPAPDEAYLFIYRLSRDSEAPEPLILTLDQAYAATEDRLERTRRRTLSEGRSELTPFMPLSLSRYRSLGGDALIYKAVELLRLGRKKQALGCARLAVTVKEGHSSALEIYGYCLTLVGRSEELASIRERYFGKLTKGARGRAERAWSAKSPPRY